MIKPTWQMNPARAYPAEIQERRALFPRGLTQPEGSFRFSLDALLLAYFLPLKSLSLSEAVLLDLGTGCGVVALAALLRSAAIHRAVGVDKQPVLLAAASENAALLGLDKQFIALENNLELPCSSNLSKVVKESSVPYVTANPPYRVFGTGRLPQNPLRRDALFGTTDTLPGFCSAAAHYMAPEGVFCLVFPHEHLKTLFTALQASKLAPTHVLPVRATYNEKPKLALVAAQKISFSQATPFPPLTLYDRHQLTPEAIMFCPLLHCNNSRRV